MSEFAASWLDLRASADALARNRALLEELAARAPSDCIDLATGTGANVRAVAPALGPRQRWVAIDCDGELLRAAPPRFAEWAAGDGASGRHRGGGVGIETPARTHEIEFVQLDLAAHLDEVALRPGALVSASALLDLVSHGWLQQLVNRCTTAHTVAYFALTYDGRIHFDPVLDADDSVVALFNRHQRGSKVFGPALGSDAARVACELFAASGFEVIQAASDWQLGAADAPLQRVLLDGYAAAAIEVERAAEASIDSWRRQRQRLLDAGRSRITVGHRDVLARPRLAIRRDE
jgi:hypothetical protein